MRASTSERSPVSGNKAKAKCGSGWAAFDLKQKAKCGSGWAAFDLKQRQKQRNLEPDHDGEAYPMLFGSTIAPQSHFNKNGALMRKPFSSVLLSWGSFPTLTDTKNGNSQRGVSASNSCPGTAQNTETDNVTIEAYQKVKYLHPWADESLIQDVLAAVNNNVDGALSSLEAMLVFEKKDAKSKKVKATGGVIASFDIQGGSVGEKTDESFITADSFSKESKDDLPSVASLGAIKSLPIEPEFEWEEDDIYLYHRKDAIRMIRSASRHSKAANDAYIRGDHTSAHQFSLKAQEEWTAAEKLNAKAATEILNVRNCKNDLWTLDLHGLHAAEAVEALRERLQTVESLGSPNCLATPDGVYKESGMFLAAPLQSDTYIKADKFGRQHPPSRQRQTMLQVITGKGNHSRGTAALPSAIRNFLSDNRYQFDENRSGVITIRPKFRQQ